MSELLAKRYAYWHSAHSEHLITWMTRAEAKERREIIAGYKPENERELRLALFKPVKGTLPAGLEGAATTWAKTYAVWMKPHIAWENALRDNMPSVLKLHSKECHPNCPWDGRTIFARGTGIEALDPAKEQSE